MPKWDTPYVIVCGRESGKPQQHFVDRHITCFRKKTATAMTNPGETNSNVLDLLNYWVWLKKQDRSIPQPKNRGVKDTENTWTLEKFRTELKEFLQTKHLTQEECERIIDQALIVIEDVYVHLFLKQSMHAVDPVRRLELLKYRLRTKFKKKQDSNNQIPASASVELDPVNLELWFHREMLSIFTELRDLHTVYILPQPFREMVAFLPFLIEECFIEECFDNKKYKKRQYRVSKVVKGSNLPFKKGAIVTHWNNVPIDRAIELNANRQAGSNDAARHARGLNALTFRPLGMTFFPDEDKVLIRYKSEESEETHETTIDWKVGQQSLVPTGVNLSLLENPMALVLGVDALTSVVQNVKKDLFATPESDQKMMEERFGIKGENFFACKVTCKVNEEGKLNWEQGKFGYIRIWNFLPPAEGVNQFVQDFLEILNHKEFPKDGLIVDVRGNSGGSILASERLLKVLKRKEKPQFTPVLFNFRNTELTLDICEALQQLQGKSEDSPFKTWRDSIKQCLETGATYSQGLPLKDSCEPEDEQQYGGYEGPMVLITDALCYSATDIFAAGFKDNELGTILGTSEKTGAGGANVWTHGLLRQLLPESNSPFKLLPKQASFLVAVRRATRGSTGSESGVPIEDLGVEADERHDMTKNDILNVEEEVEVNGVRQTIVYKNMDLLAEAVKILKKQTGQK